MDPYITHNGRRGTIGELICSGGSRSPSPFASTRIGSMTFVVMTWGSLKVGDRRQTTASRSDGPGM